MDPLWYKDAVIYELHVRSFYDANGDGYGDFAGLKERLPYLQELGVNTLWLLPFYESPLRDDGYDISDYYKILPVHGSLEDFKSFLDEAHARGLKVITELVLNHTSDQHPWFQEARQPGSARRDWYVWSKSTDRYKEARIIFKDFEHSNWTWDPVAQAYYWHRFFSHQPDLNWDNPEVEAAMHQVMFYWLDLGVDGLRLDAIPYLYEREGTSCENLPETLAAVKRLRQAIEDRYGPGRILLAEANQWPEDTLPYFGEGDGVQMAFNFPVMPRLYMALRREDREPIVEMLELTSGIPETAQWAYFLRNHDELTLEMVTDEERDYLYHEYAADPQFRINLGIRRRLAPLLGGSRRRIELMHALLLFLKGTPVLYYGDEIGMGDNPFLGDRNGVRTPMQWSADRNAGFSRAPYHKLFLPPISEGPYSYHFVNVEAEREDPHSLLNFVRRLLAIRNRYAQVLGRGSLEILPVENRHILAILRRYQGQSLLMVANLSRFSQAAQIPLGAFEGQLPIELFSQAPFPPAREGYPINLGPHSFEWFALAPATPLELESSETEEALRLPRLRLHGGLETLLVDTLVQGKAREQLEAFLPQWLARQRWFGAKGQEIHRVRLEDAVRLLPDPPTYLTLLRVSLAQGEERYLLPLSLEPSPPETAQAALAELRGPWGQAVLYDATISPRFWQGLYDRWREGWSGRSLKGRYLAQAQGLPPAHQVHPLGVEQSNSSAIWDEGIFAKLYRKLEEGPNPEPELLEHLTRLGFPYIPHLLGQLTFRRGSLSLHLGLLQEALPGDGDGWSYALEELGKFIGRIQQAQVPEHTPPSHPLSIPGWLEDPGAEVLELARRLGVRTAELHLALAQAQGPGLNPEPLAPEDLPELAHRLEEALQEARALLRAHPLRGQPTQAEWQRGLRRVRALAELPGGWLKIRIHGDYHLGQILRSRGELFILDFEGEPNRPLAERRQPAQALKDVAGMLRSFAYAAAVALGERPKKNVKSWVQTLLNWAQALFLEAYQTTAGEAAFLPPPLARSGLLWGLQLEKALYELSYELGHRPEWARIPLEGLRQLLKEDEDVAYP
jgi:maltose alpha-D-glucosyltransferase/alpha-amylase